MKTIDQAAERLAEVVGINPKFGKTETLKRYRNAIASYSSEVTETLAKERDEFGARETRLLAKLAGAEAECDRLRQCLEYIELTGANAGHDPKPIAPCRCGACMANEASKALGDK